MSLKFDLIASSPTPAGFLFFSLKNSFAFEVNIHGIVETISFAHGIGIFKDRSSESHVHTLSDTARAPLGGEDDLSEECGSSSSGTDVGVSDTMRLGGGTFGFTFTIVIGTSYNPSLIFGN